MFFSFFAKSNCPILQVEIEMAGLRKTGHHKAILFLTIVASTTQSIKADSPPLKLVRENLKSNTNLLRR